MKYLLNIVLGFVFLFSFAYFAQNVYHKKKAEKSTLTPTKAVEGVTPPQDNTNLTVKTLYVSPFGDDGNNGISEITPFSSIQKAVDSAFPGDTIEILAGTYLQDIVTKRAGTKGSPIRIRGQKDTVVKGAGSARIIEINHGYITLEGFTVDGHYRESEDKKSYRDKLVYITGKLPLTPLEHVVLTNMNIRNAGGECIRLRYFVQNSEISHNTISNCGVGDFAFDDGGKNGEGIYIGTAPEQRTDGKNPTADVDNSNANWIHHNMIDTQGNECVDIKEGSSHAIVEYNECTGQKDPESGGMDSRGNENVFRYNTISGNIGAGVRLGGDGENDGIHNEVYNNKIINNESGGIKFQRHPQGKICGNELIGNGKGEAVGSYGEEFTPSGSCI